MAKAVSSHFKNLITTSLIVMQFLLIILLSRSLAISANTVITHTYVIPPKNEEERRIASIETLSLFTIRFEVKESEEINYNITLYKEEEEVKHIIIFRQLTGSYKLMFVGEGEYYCKIINKSNESLILTLNISITSISKGEEQDLYLIASSNGYLWYTTLQPFEQKEYSLSQLENREYIVFASILSIGNNSQVDFYVSPLPANQTGWDSIARKYIITSSFFERRINISDVDEWLIAKSRSGIEVSIIIVFSIEEEQKGLSVRDIILGIAIIIILLLFLRVSSKKQRSFGGTTRSGKTIDAEEVRKHSIQLSSRVNPGLPYIPPLVKQYIEEQKRKKNE